MNLAIVIEGYLDNVVFVLFGGCCLIVFIFKGWVVCDIFWYFDIVLVVVILDFEFLIIEVWWVILIEYICVDVIFNCVYLGILLRGLEIGYGEWL